MIRAKQSPERRRFRLSPSVLSFPLSLPRSAHPRRLLATFRDWVKENWPEILVVAAITGVGAFFRLYRLDNIPAGMLGDEAWTPLRAQAILDGEWAGPYDPYHGAGQPAGLEFWAAGVIALFGDSIFVIRMSTALVAIAAIPISYLLFRAIDGKTTAIIGSSLLALSSWHLVFSRLAYPPVSVVTAELLAALVLLLALRSQKWRLFSMAGIALALGIYTFNAYAYFLIGVAALLAGWLVTQRARLRRALPNVAALAAGFLLATLPMLRFLKEHQDVYLGRARSESIFNSTRFEEASGLLERADVVLDAGRDFVKLVVFEGAHDVPMLAIATSVLLGLGILLAARRWREPGIALALVLVLVIPWAAILNPSGGSIMVRRSLGVTPFIALLAALPLSAVLRSRYLAAPHLRAIVLVAAVAAILSVGVTNMSFYFRDYANSPGTKLHLNYPIMEASRFMASLPGDPYVYFYSSQWPFDYVVRRYLAPDVEGEDRSGEWESEFDLTPDRDRDVVYVFMRDTFAEAYSEVQDLFPGGHAFESIDEDGAILFRAYYLPREVSLSGP